MIILAGYVPEDRSYMGKLIIRQYAVENVELHQELRKNEGVDADKKCVYQPRARR